MALILGCVTALALAVAFVGSGAARAVYRGLQRRWFRRRVWRTWRALMRAYQHSGERLPLLVGLNQLLRRVARRVAVETPVAGLCGPAWLVFLDEQGQTRRFSRGPGQILAAGPYRREQDLIDEEVDMADVLGLVEAWLREVV